MKSDSEMTHDEVCEPMPMVKFKFDMEYETIVGDKPTEYRDLKDYANGQGIIDMMKDYANGQSMIINMLPEGFVDSIKK